MKALRLLLPLAFFALYLATLYPTVSPYRDSGDMAASAATLGVSHPPGYPLYALGGRAWLGLLPFGDPAYRLNVWSAFCAALALGLLAAVLERWTGSALAGAGAALFLGLSPCFWALAQVSEMYALNALAAACVVWSWPKAQAQPARLYFCAFLTGLALGNHQTLVFMVPATAWAFWRSGEGRPAVWTRAALFGVLGLTIYLYLPLRSLQDPWLDWGEPHGLREFWRVMTRADYGGLRLHPEKPLNLGWEAITNAARVSAAAFGRQAGILGLAVSAAGFWSRRREPWAQALAAAGALSGPAFIFLSNLPAGSAETLPILEPHLVLPTLCLAPFFGVGALALADLARRPAARTAAAVLTLLLPVVRARDAHGTLANRSNFSAHDYGLNLLSALEPGSLLIDPDDPTAFTLSYFAAARGRREDVVPLMYFRTRWGYRRLRRRHPELLPAAEIRSGPELYLALLRQNLAAGRPVYADLPQKVQAPYDTFPQGWAYRVLPPGAPPLPKPQMYSRAARLWEVARARPHPGGDFFTSHTLDYGASALNNLGVQALGDRQSAPAIAWFKAALIRQPRLSEGWNNWGNALFNLKEHSRAAAAYRFALEAKPSPQYRYNLGRTLWATGDEAGAEQAYQAALAEEDIPAAVNDLGLIWLNRGEAGRAEQAFEGLVRRRPDYRPAWYNLGLARHRLGQLPGAAEAFTAYRDSASDPADRAEAEAWLRKLAAGGRR